MEAEKGTGEGTLFQNSKAIFFFTLASLLFSASLSQVLTCIFSVSSFAFPKSRIISLGKNIKDGNLRNPPHVLREPDLLVSHPLSLPPSPTQTLPRHLNLSTEQREGRFLLTRRPSQRASHSGTTFFSLGSRASASGAETPPLAVPVVFPGRAAGTGTGEKPGPSCVLGTAQSWRLRAPPGIRRLRGFSTADSALPAAPTVCGEAALCWRHGPALQLYGAAAQLRPSLAMFR